MLTNCHCLGAPVGGDPLISSSSSSSEDEADKKGSSVDKKKKKKKQKSDYSGEIEIPNLSEENDMDEVDVSYQKKA